jgi:HTH-type transcriptional regulator/antitoxin MqsA
MTQTAQCHVCGESAALVSLPFEVTLGERVATVLAARMQCSSCGTEFFLPEQMDAAQRAAADEMRSQDGLLRPDEIKAIRAQYDLTQSQLEELLGVGAKTVVRWERGTVFQNRATDALLRLIGAVPEAAIHLASLRNMELRTIASVEQPSLGSKGGPVMKFKIWDPSPDPKIISIEPYLPTKQPLPIPPDLLREANL